MKLATEKSILYVSLPANLDISDHMDRMDMRGGVNEDVVRLMEGLDLDSWSDWSSKNSSHISPEREKRLESFLLEWNNNSTGEEVCAERVIIDPSGSGGSISDNLAVKRTPVGARPEEPDAGHITSDVPDKIITPRHLGAIKKKLIFGNNAPIHILQQPGTPQTSKNKKRKLEYFNQEEDMQINKVRKEEDGYLFAPINPEQIIKSSEKVGEKVVSASIGKLGKMVVSSSIGKVGEMVVSSSLGKVGEKVVSSEKVGEMAIPSSHGKVGKVVVSSSPEKVGEKDFLSGKSG